MSTFLSSQQREIVEEIANMLINRSEKIAVAESTAGGLISAALLSFPGASRYYAGGGVVYTLNSRIQIAGVSPEEYENYRGTTEEMLATLVKSISEIFDIVRSVFSHFEEVALYKTAEPLAGDDN